VHIDLRKHVGSKQPELNENESMALSDGEILGRVNFNFQLRQLASVVEKESINKWERR
jgi:hypothetical protein